jgi:ABC-type phosphate transport system permease subunit
MSPLDPEIPPAGEEIHLPGPSIQPFLLAIGITMIVVGLTFHPVVLIGGIVFSVLVIAAWIRDARHELAALPAEHR